MKQRIPFKKLTALLLTLLMLAWAVFPAYAETTRQMTETTADDTEPVTQPTQAAEPTQTATEAPEVPTEAVTAEPVVFSEMSEEEVRALFDEMAQDHYAIHHSYFSQFPLSHKRAYQYYSERFGIKTLGALLQKVKAESTKKSAGREKAALAGTGASTSGSVGNIKWSVSGTTMTFSGSGAMPDFNYYYTYDPNYTKSPWSDNNKDTITKVVIGEGITTVGTENFYEFSKLTEVVLPSTIASIGIYAFNRCESLESISLPDGLKEIDNYAFAECLSLKSITLPDSVERLGEGVFEEDSELERVYLGAELKVIGSNPFVHCDGLQNITLSKANQTLSFKNNALYDSSATLITYFFPDTPISSYTIASGTKVIGKAAFSRGYDDYSRKPLIGAVYFPDSVVSVEAKAFYHLKASSFFFNEGLESIGDTALFFNNITSVTLPESLTCIGRGAFGCCFELQSITIPKNVKSIGQAAFDIGFDSKLKSISVDSANQYYKSVGGVLYTKDGKTLHTYPSAIANTSFTIPDTVVTLEEYAFSYITKLKTVKLSNNLRRILWSNFHNCTAIEEITIPDSVVEVDVMAFWYMDSLKKATVGKGVFRLNGALSYNDNLTSVYFRGDLPEDYQEMIYKESGSVTIYYPKNNATWKNGNIKLGYSNQILKPWDGVNYERIRISNADITLDKTTYTYDGTAKKPGVTVKYDGETLVEGKDYSLEYKDTIDAGSPVVYIYGIGNYQGSVTRYYTINKAKGVVTASLEPKTVKVGGFAKISASGPGNILYSSSNPSVAQVDTSGIVSGNKVGTATITVSAKGNRNYTSATRSLSVSVVRTCPTPTLNKLSYSFGNNSEAFGYSKGYKIPLDSFKVIFPDAQARTLYNGCGKWLGGCYGFSFTSQLFNVPDSGLSVSQFRSSATRVGDLKVSDRSSKYGFNVTRLIEAGWCAQLSPLSGEVHRRNRNNYKGFIDEVKKCDNGGAPVEFGMIRYYDDGTCAGHSILAYKYEYVNKTTQRVHVYDCNASFKDRYITFTTNSSGTYTGWNYSEKYNSKYSGYFDYTPYYYHQQIWDHRRDANFNYRTSVIIKNDSFDVFDSEGNKVASMDNGVFTSEKNDIYETIPMMDDDVEPQKLEEHYLYMPTDKYTIVSREDTYEKPLEFTVLDHLQSATVKTESDTVEFMVDDSQNTNLMNVDGKSGERYEITFNGDNDYTTDKSEVIFAGKSEGEAVEVGTVDGAYVNSGYKHSGIREEDTAINLPYNNKLDLAKGSLDLSQSTYTFSGEPIEPDFTVLDENGDPLSANRDYKVVYTNNNGSGTAHAEVFGVNDYFGKLEFDFTIGSVSLSDCDIRLEYDECTATGEKLEPNVTVSYKGVELVQNVHYSLLYAYNKRPGIAEVRISAVSGCSGSATPTFRILPNDRLPKFEYTVLDDDTAEITAFYGSEADVVIPDEIDGYKVSSIGYACFSDNFYIETVVLPDTITNIGSFAFAECPNLTSVKLPDSVTTIQSYAFRHSRCIDFTKLPKNLQTIGTAAFYDSGKIGGNISLPDSLTTIGSYAFTDSIYTWSVTIPPSVTSIAARSLGYYYMDDGNLYRNSRFIIRGYAGSAAQQYADTYGFIFEAVDGILLGDVNGDARVNALDRIIMTRYINDPSQNKALVNLKNADVNLDREVNATDRAILTRYVAKWKDYSSLPK